MYTFSENGSCSSNCKVIKKIQSKKIKIYFTKKYVKQHRVVKKCISYLLEQELNIDLQIIEFKLILA